jgi:succinate dehydrogenase/fumarate reductase cytochrome b subunit
MQITLIVTQVLHVLSGVFWAGTTFALARMSSDQATQMFKPQMGAAVVAVASGGLLWFLLHRGPPGPQEHILALGAIFALVAAGIQGITASALRNRAGSAEADLTRLRRRAVTGQRIAAGLLGITVACMAASRYV